MNKLPLQARITILNMLVEGSSMRSISRVTGVSINTVTKPGPRGPYRKKDNSN